MKNRTIYDVLDKVMEDYRYEIEKKGNKVVLNGDVFIPRLEITITHKMEFYCSDKSEKDLFRAKIDQFKDELRSLVAKTLKDHETELTDDEEMIDKLLYEVKRLTEELGRTKEELALANQKISQLEFEKLVQPYQPYPWTVPNPASTGTTPWDNPNPWSTGITWETQICNQPDWMNKNNITCSTDEGNTSATYGNGDGVIFHTSEYRKRNPKRFG
jgi:hypothetical protein